MPLLQVRSLLNDKGEGKWDIWRILAQLPQYDGDFQNWCQDITESFGNWPKGPLNAVELWNEPWEGSSISGWGADMPRYTVICTRTLLRAGRGSRASIRRAGSDRRHLLLDEHRRQALSRWKLRAVPEVAGLHQHPLPADERLEPALIKAFQDRKSPYGAVKVWDTESWIANSEDRVAAVIASMRAQGQQRTAGVLHDVTRSAATVHVRQEKGPSITKTVVQALPPAAAIGAATQQFIGQRKFKEILLKNGLPWIFVFDGLTGPDDGSVVVVGDLGNVYERNLLLFRTVLGLKARQRSAALRPELAALPGDAPVAARNELLKRIQIAEVLDDAQMSINDAEGHFMTFDFYGNPIAAAGGKVVVPLNGLGYFVRTDGSAGSFASLLAAIRVARIDGYEPVEIVAHDLLARVESGPALRLTITNVLNRPISGKLEVKLAGLQLENALQMLQLNANETRQVAVKIIGGAATVDNTYPLSAVFDGGADGAAVHEEKMHVNVIAKKTITVDGNLDDWKDVLPQPIRSQPGSGKNLTEKAWLPFAKFEDVTGIGVASGFLAYDDKNFYFAAKIADASPYEGNLRYATRDEDADFYPETSYRIEMNPKTHQMERKQTLHWPQGVRRYSYRRDPQLPSGAGTDNVQIAFNVLPIEQTDWLPYPPGTMPRFMVYKTTDYEYALNPVAAQFGGGTELWRLAAPGVPRKHFYPRQPRAPKDGGPVEGGQLVIRHDGNTRIVECASLVRNPRGEETVRRRPVHQVHLPRERQQGPQLRIEHRPKRVKNMQLCPSQLLGQRLGAGNRIRLREMIRRTSSANTRNSDAQSSADRACSRTPPPIHIRHIPHRAAPGRSARTSHRQTPARANSGRSRGSDSADSCSRQ